MRNVMLAIVPVMMLALNSTVSGGDCGCPPRRCCVVIYCQPTVNPPTDPMANGNGEAPEEADPEGGEGDVADRPSEEIAARHERIQNHLDGASTKLAEIEGRMGISPEAAEAGSDSNGDHMEKTAATLERLMRVVAELQAGLAEVREQLGTGQEESTETPTEDPAAQPGEAEGTEPPAGNSEAGEEV